MVFSGRIVFCGNLSKPAGDPAVMAFLKGRIDGNLLIVNKRLASQPYLLGDKPTITDISMTGYFYYPAEESASTSSRIIRRSAHGSNV